MLAIYNSARKLIEEYFNGEGITKEINLLSAYFLLKLMEKNPDLTQYQIIKTKLKLAIKKYQKNQIKLGDRLFDEAKVGNEKLVRECTEILSNMPQELKDKLNVDVNYDYSPDWWGVVID